MSAGTGDHAASSQPMHSAENDSDVVASAPCNNTAPCDNTDIEGRPIHRLAMQDNTLPMIPMGPSAARKIYDRCTEVVKDCCDVELSPFLLAMSFVGKTFLHSLRLFVFVCRQ